MTAPSAAQLAPVDVWNGLRAWAAVGPAGVGAGVELLIWHETWLRRRDFLDAATRHDVEQGMVAIRWHDAATFALTARASAAELSTLQFAIALGADQFRIAGLGHAHREAFARAFAAAATGGTR